MHSDAPTTISARIIIDPADLPAAVPPGLVETMAPIERQLARLESREADDARILIDIGEAAKRLGVCAGTLAKIEDLPAVKIGARRMYRVRTIEAWAAQQEKQAQAMEAATD